MNRIRIKRFLLFLLLIFIKNIILFLIIFSSPSIQSFLTKNIINYAAKYYDIDLSLKKIYLDFPDKIVFDNIMIKDSIGDTLIFSKNINIEISKIKILDNQLFIENINFNEPLINILVDTIGNANYTYILKKFISDNKDTISTKSQPIEIKCENFTLKNSIISYKDARFNNNSEVFDINNFYFSGINLQISDISYKNDSISLKLKNLSFHEKSGINISKFSTDILYHPKGIELNNVILKTQYSELICNEISLKGEDENYFDDLFHKAQIKLKIDTLIFDFADLYPFFPEYKLWHDKVYIAGDFNGKLSNIKLKNFNLFYGENTKLSADLSVDGLPNLDLAFIFGNISNLNTNVTDIQRLLYTISPTDAIKLSSSLTDINYINFNGKITGMLNDLVTYGNINSGIGSVKTDIRIKSDFENYVFNYKGKIQANNVDLGKITGEMNTLGDISFVSKLDGKIDTLGNFETKIDLNISELNFNNYTYSNIIFNGFVKNDYYDGTLNIKDPNLTLELFGKFDNRYDSQKLDISADIETNLSAINLMPDSLNSSLKIALFADFKGNFLDFPEGNLYLSELKYIQNNDLLKAKSLALNSYIDKNTNEKYLVVRSDFIDANLYGKFIFPELAVAINNLISTYLPSLISPIAENDFKSENYILFDFKVKNIDKVTKIFLPELSINEDISGEGNFSNLKNNLDIVISLPEIKYDSIYFWGSQIDINTIEDSLNLNLAVQEISTKTFPWFENLTLKTKTYSDNIELNLLWDNYDTLRNAGDISLNSRFVFNNKSEFPEFYSTIEKSWFSVNNSLWQIEQTPITFKENTLNIDNFKISNNSQSLSLDGDISSDPEKILRFLIKDVDVSIINTYIENTGFKIWGNLSGNGRISKILDKPNFRSSLSISDFKINEENFGRFDISASWTDNTDGLRIEGVNNIMKVRGAFYPETDSLDFNLNVDNLKLNMFEDYLKDLEITNIDGKVDFILSIIGNIKNPNITGFIKFDNTTLTYDFLQLHILTNDKISFNNNSIVFENFKIYDRNNNEAIINGLISHKNFQNFKFDINADFENFNIMNTTEKDNDIYYGTANGTGNLKITGDLDNYGIDVIAKTEPGTKFFLPMTESYETSNINFLTFLQPAVDSNKNNDYLIQSSSSKYYFKMDIEVTPDAEIQIVFDPKVGDILKGYAKGNIKMEYTSDEDFYMYGEAEIVEGDYLFTLQNIINKKFHIQPGGTITWFGDPYEAELNLNAVYYTRAPLKELMTGFEVDSIGIYNKPVNIECYMNLTGSLMSPNIIFDIKIPNADEKVQNQLSSMTQDEINKQMLYLLIANRFNSAMPGTDPSSQIGTTTNTVGVTSSELLSNQLSNWLSQISKDFDIGFKYRPGVTDISDQELEFALSTQLLNDRLLINGNMAVGGNNNQNSALVGDIEAQLKVNKSGSFRLKGYTRANEDIEAEFGPYTNGIGIFYTKDFNNLKELFSEAWQKITFRKNKERTKKKIENKIP